MDPNQRTFTVVPARAGTAAPPPPQHHGRIVTSKQLEKLYKQTKRTKRLTRLEQLEADRREQERIRRELAEAKKRENEIARNRKKAQQAKEKQRAREQAIRDERRRKGEAPVGCRPSQGTLTRFFRGNGCLRKRDALGVVVGEEQDEEERSVPEEEPACVDDHVEPQRSPPEAIPATPPLDDKATPGGALIDGFDSVTDDDDDPFGDESWQFRDESWQRPRHSNTTTPPQPRPSPSKRQPSLAPAAAPMLSALELDMLFEQDPFQPSQLLAITPKRPSPKKMAVLDAISPEQGRADVAIRNELELDSDGLFDDEPVLTPSPKPAPKPPDELAHSSPPAPVCTPPSTQAFLFDHFDDFFSRSSSQETISPPRHEAVAQSTKQPSTPSATAWKRVMSHRAPDSPVREEAAPLIVFTQDLEFTFQDLQEITQRGPAADISAFSLALSLSPPSLPNNYCPPSSQYRRNPQILAPQSQSRPLLTPEQAQTPKKHGAESDDEQETEEEQDGGETVGSVAGLRRWEAERREHTPEPPICKDGPSHPAFAATGASCASAPPLGPAARQDWEAAAPACLAASQQTDSQETDYGDFGLDGRDLEEMEARVLLNERDFEGLDDDIDF